MKQSQIYPIASLKIQVCNPLLNPFKEIEIFSNPSCDEKKKIEQSSAQNSILGYLVQHLNFVHYFGQSSSFVHKMY